MSPEDSLESVWQVYETTRDCFKVTQRAVRRNDVASLGNTQFVGASAGTAQDLIMSSREDFENFAVVSLWVVFERHIIAVLQSKLAVLLAAEPRSLSKELHGYTEKQAEYWKFDDVLDILKTIVTPDLIVHAKKIKKYRDWVVHRNPRKGSPDKTDARTAHAVFQRIIESIRNAAE